MTWKLLDRPFMATRNWVRTLVDRPTEISPGRWRAMQLQLSQDLRREYMIDQSMGDADSELVFWVRDAVS